MLYELSLNKEEKSAKTRVNASKLMYFALHLQDINYSYMSALWTTILFNNSNN